MVGMEGIYSDHSHLDERSLALHQLIAARVLADPALLDKARANLRRWQQMEAARSWRWQSGNKFLAAQPIRSRNF